MKKAWLVTIEDYEEYLPVGIYLNKDKAIERQLEEQRIINEGRENQKRHVAAGGQYYSLNPWYSSSVSANYEEVDLYE